MSSEIRPECPSCGSTKVAEIVFGYPTEETLEAGTRGELVLGGCIVSEIDPEWHCTACDHEW